MDEDSKDGLDNNVSLTMSNGIKLNIDPCPVCDILFCGDEGELGRLTFDDNQIHFTGKADESAKIFFENFLKPLCDDYIKERLDNGTTKAPTNSPEAHNGD